MKKIMFNDAHGLTKAVLEGRKTMTRRLVPSKTLDAADAYVQQIHGTGHDFLDYLLSHAPFKVGEVVAVAQSYRAIHEEMWCNDTDTEENLLPYYEHFEDAGYDNKMFVLADLMPHRIRIKNVKVERLQDISNEDCLREGIIRYTCCLYEFRGLCYSFPGDKAKMGTHKTPVEAFAALIDKVSGKGTWESNPLVWVYEFELEKLLKEEGL